MKAQTSAISPLSADKGATTTLFLKPANVSGFPASALPNTDALALASADSVVRVFLIASSCFSSVRLTMNPADEISLESGDKRHQVSRSENAMMQIAW